MKKLLTAALLLIATTANADLYTGGNYINLKEESISLGGAGITLGYEQALTQKQAVIFEARMGVGVKDDSFSGVKAEIDNYRIFSLKGKHETDSGIYFLAMVSHATLELEASYGRNTVTGTEKENGYGLGLGYDFETSRIDTELTLEKFGDAKIFTFNLKMDF